MQDARVTLLGNLSMVNVHRVKKQKTPILLRVKGSWVTKLNICGLLNVYYVYVVW